MSNPKPKYSLNDRRAYHKLQIATTPTQKKKDYSKGFCDYLSGYCTVDQDKQTPAYKKGFEAAKRAKATAFTKKF